MDEPTNHLDIQSKAILKEALKNFDGTLILVSHDREFLDGLVNKVFEFKDGKVKEFLGGISEYLEERKAENFRSEERRVGKECRSMWSATCEITKKQVYAKRAGTGEKLET